MSRDTALINEILSHLDELAKAPVLLVASDFDGTLAPIAANPSDAIAERATLIALRALSQLPQTHVAVISGRALGDLASRVRDVEELHLVGSHGSEFEAGFSPPLEASAVDLLRQLKQDVAVVAAECPGCYVEEKPASLAFHYRNADAASSATAIAAILRGPGRLPGVFLRHAKMAIELSVVETNKGVALQRLRQRLGASAVLFLGDDTTDEDAIATLCGPDIGIKVGIGPTRAQFRVYDSGDVGRVLAHVAQQRETWLSHSSSIPIEKHSMLSDQRTIALVDSEGRIDWLCLPRIDSSAIFADLVGGRTAGYFSISPLSGGKPLSQQYVGDTFVLETKWPSMSVVDYLECTTERAFQRAGRTDLIRVINGSGRVRLIFSPRLDFGRMVTRLRIDDHGIEVEGAVDPVVLRSPGIPWRVAEEGRHQTAIADFELGKSPVVLELRCGTASLAADIRDEQTRQGRTQRYWTDWAATLKLPNMERDLVRRSALILKGLCYGPSGGIAAAGTSSLPETIGGTRNWDYRYCWLRDGAMVATSLLRLGSPGTSIQFLDWVLGVVDQCEPASFVNPVYTVTGGHLGPEGEITELSGYRGSRPVRIGNQASQQIQLDVFGPIADLIARLAEQGEPLSSEHWHLLDTMVHAIGTRWHEPDHGIWEERRSRRHHVHSKVMCWQTVDRALTVASYLGRRRHDWIALRNEIANDVLAKGWNPAIDSFSAAYGNDDADASVLAIGLSGLVDYSDPRFTKTVEYVERTLRTGPVVYRYRFDDGLPGVEGGFLLCTSWLIQSLALTGRCDEAMSLFQQYCRLAGPTGALAEQYDPSTGTALGNVPQAYSHVGLIDSAVTLEATLRR